MGMVKIAARDAAMTFLWVGCASTLRPLTANLFSYLQPRPPLALLLRTTIVFLLRYIFISIGKFLGGASFNPAITTTFYAAGLGRGSLFSLAIRFPAQAVGAMGGASAVKELMPMPHKNLLGGPSIKVDLHTGAIAEGILTFCFNLALLFVIIRGPNSTILKVWLLSMVTVSLRMAGSSYTGPSMNPANAYGWAYVRNRHNTWEQFYVYWICPLIGSVTAALFFRLFFSPPKPKEKKA
ncbi:aquaporin SIP1-1 isoform X2 [Nymphaea colorata]|nr:aquaporin SIP1-1 isoform X2 [Nymphaea colorata]